MLLLLSLYSQPSCLQNFKKDPENNIALQLRLLLKNLFVNISEKVLRILYDKAHLRLSERLLFTKFQ